MCDECARPERHAHRGLREDGVPALHIEPIRARLRQRRVVVQELKQDDDEVVTPRLEPQHVDTSKNKSAHLGKRDDWPCDPPHKERNL